MDVFPKFIVEDDAELGLCVVISKCTYHKELTDDVDIVKGGGFYAYDSDEKTFTFSGSSHDFGEAREEDIKTAIANGNVYTNTYQMHDISKNYKFFYDIGSEIIKL